MIVDEWPDHFPGAWQDIPLEVRRYLTQRLLDKSLGLHDGPAGLIKFLYAGTMRDGHRLSYLTGGVECWAFVVADAKAWLAERAAKPSSPSSTVDA